MLSPITIYRAFSRIFIPRFEDIGVIGSFSASKVDSMEGSSFRGTERMSFSSRSSVIKSIFYCLLTLSRILPFSFSVWAAPVVIVYTVLFKGVDEEGLFETMLVREVVPKLRLSTLSAIDSTSISNMIANSTFITGIFP